MWTYCYTSLLLYLSIYNYVAHAADILSPTTVMQGVDNNSWGLYCHHCYYICVSWGCSSQLFLFSRWLGHLSTLFLTKDETPHTGYTLTPRLMSFTPPSIKQVGRRDLDFMSHPKDDGRFLVIQTKQPGRCSVLCVYQQVPRYGVNLDA